MRKLWLILALAALTATGCTVNLDSLFGGGSPDQSHAGGVFRSEDFGQTWQKKSSILSASGNPLSFDTLDGLSLKQDPTDAKTWYFGSLDQGLLYSYDNGETWQLARSLGSRPIASVAVDHNDHCRLYVGSNNKVWLSEDCSRSWKQIYSDTDTTLLINSVLLDFHDTKIVYMTNSRGDVLKSEDDGANWRTIFQIKEKPVIKLVMSQQDSRVMMAATRSSGVFRTKDGGESWEDLSPKLKSYPSAKNFRDLVTSAKQPGLWLMATRYGLLRTVNDGDDWTAVDLITPENDAVINSVAISQQDANKIYYVTDNSFYYSMDAGRTWKSLKLPTPRKGLSLAPDFSTDGRLFLTTRSR